MTASARQLSYPARALVGDYARAGIGFVLTAGPAAVVPADSIALWIFGSLAVLFVAFGLRTARRHASRLELGDDRISLFGPGQVSFAWEELAAVRLSYYSTTADRQGGWMQLTLEGEGGGTIRLDSTLDGFVDVARRAARAAKARGLGLSSATASNFQALGIAVDAPAEPAVPQLNRTER